MALICMDGAFDCLRTRPAVGEAGQGLDHALVRAGQAKDRVVGLDPVRGRLSRSPEASRDRLSGRTTRAGPGRDPLLTTKANLGAGRAVAIGIRVNLARDLRDKIEAVRGLVQSRLDRTIAQGPGHCRRKMIVAAHALDHVGRMELKTIKEKVT